MAARLRRLQLFFMFAGGRVVATARPKSGQVLVALPPERHIAYRCIMAVDPETNGDVLVEGADNSRCE